MKPYDLSLLEELEDRQQLLDIVDMFLANAPGQIKDLLAEAGNKAWDKVYAHAHKLKGSAGVFQAHELVQLLRKLEGQIHAGRETGMDEDAINPLLRDLSYTFRKMAALLQEECNQ